MAAQPALQISGLTKSFRGKRAVDGLNLRVERGEILGFLGPNGAGKTTVMNIVAGLIPPDDGEVALFGISGGAKRREVRLRLGYLPEKPRIYAEMSARAYLAFFASLYGLPEPARRICVVLDRVGLAAAADRPLGTYSRGMQQRACLARAMLHEPEFLMLDEPTLGLDPPAVAEMREIFREMRAGGATLFFSSHQLAEIERICDRVAFISDGKLLAIGPPAELMPGGVPANTYHVELQEPVAGVMGAICGIPAVASAQETGPHEAEVVLRARQDIDARDARAALVRHLTGVGLTVLAVHSARPGLEDVFLALSEPGRPAQGMMK